MPPSEVRRFSIRMRPSGEQIIDAITHKVPVHFEVEGVGSVSVVPDCYRGQVPAYVHGIIQTEPLRGLHFIGDLSGGFAFIGQQTLGLELESFAAGISREGLEYLSQLEGGQE
jgi:hypothetical protein